MSVAVNNKLIYKLLADPSYRVQKNGKVLRLDSKKSKFTPVATFEGDNGRLKLRYRGKNLFVSRIVYAAYGPQKLSGTKIVDHKNSDRMNNSIQNLQQITQSANIKKKTSNRFFSGDQVAYMRRMFAKGLSFCAISRIMHRPTRSVVWAIKYSKRG